jgi:hypothetical protein
VFALALVFAGFMAIVLGWVGMARSAAADEQLPFIVSGGMGGVGLVTFGVGVLLVAQIRTERQQLTAVLEVMASAVLKITGGAIAPEEETGPVPADTLVVAGPSTFHRPECKLVRGKPGLDRLTIQVARSTGLSPCRVCDPLGTSERQGDGTGSGSLVAVGSDGKGADASSQDGGDKTVRLEDEGGGSDVTKESRRPTLPGEAPS